MLQLHQAGVPTPVMVMIRAHDKTVTGKHKVLGDAPVADVDGTCAVNLVVMNLDAMTVKVVELVNVDDESD